MIGYFRDALESRRRGADLLDLAAGRRAMQPVRARRAVVKVSHTLDGKACDPVMDRLQTDADGMWLERPAIFVMASHGPVASSGTALIEAVIARNRACGKPAGILTPDNAFAARCIEIGTLFTAVGVDAAMLAKATESLAPQ